MNTLNYIIVEVDNKYNNQKEIERVGSIIINNTIESVEHINRVAKVKSAPNNTILKEGDDIILHHNILRLRYDTKGKQIESDYFIKDNLYFVPPTQIFMYRRNKNEDWIAITPYCFVKPMKKDKVDKVGSIHIPSNVKDNTHKGMVKNIGFLSYLNEDLTSMGLKKDDKILFSKDSEYEFNIEGEVYYKMSTSDIMGLIE